MTEKNYCSGAATSPIAVLLTQGYREQIQILQLSSSSGSCNNASDFFFFFNITRPHVYIYKYVCVCIFVYTPILYKYHKRVLFASFLISIKFIWLDKINKYTYIFGGDYYFRKLCLLLPRAYVP